MDLINNRYRVLKNIRQNRFISSYLVSDMNRNFNAVQLNIINSEYLPENLLTYYIEEFKALTTIEDDHIVKLHDFGIIKMVDNKKMDNHQYFYVNENVETNVSFMNLVRGLDENKVLDLFVQICQSINYLHLRNFVYGSININNIYVDGLNIKLKDMATLELEKYDYKNSKDNLLIFKAPEVLAEGKVSAASDIYSLGVLLLFMSKKEVDETTSISKQISKLKYLKSKYKSYSESYILFLQKISKILQKMLEADINKRYKSIDEVIKDINKVFGKNYKSHSQEQIEKLNFKTKLVGREYEINTIIDAYSSMKKSEFQKKFVIIHGEYGIGKTKILKEAEYLLSMKNPNVYSSFSLDTVNSLKNRAFFEILRKIIGECDSEVLARYESELIKMIPELGNKKNIIPVEELPGHKEKIRALNTILGFINDSLKGKPAVFIVDNLHMANDFSIDILEYMYLRSKNIMFIFSYCEGEFTYNKRLVEFISKLYNKSNVVDIQLHGLEKEDSISMIQDILRTPSRPVNFGERIFSKTYGNPLFIEETIKNFFAQKILYVDESTGKWISKYDYDYNKMPIPSNMEQAVLAQIKGIDNLSKQILSIVSIFNTGVPMETINIILQEDASIVKESIENLESKGILCQKIEDRGFVYDFSNRILKLLIGERLDEEYRKTMHETAATLLEEQYVDGMVNSEELIYHLEMSNQKEKIIKYCLENADKMEAYKNRAEAIKNLKKAVSMLEDESNYRKIELLLRIGQIYEESGNGVKAVDYYTQVKNLAVELGNSVYEIQALNKIANVFFNKNEIFKTLNCIASAEKLLEKTDLLGRYLEEYLECKEIQSRVYYLKQKYKKVEDICIRGINLCGESHYKLKGLFYKNLGNACIQTGKIEKALNCYKESRICFENINYNEGIAMILNNIAVVYADYYQDNKKNIEYLKSMKEISEKNHIMTFEVMALTNLACSYYYEWNYDLALQYMLEAVEKGKALKFESNIFYCYNYLSNIYLKLGHYKEAYNYFLLAEKELEQYPEQGKDIGIYYQMGADLFYTFGDSERARNFITKALEVYKEDEFIQKWDSQILSQFIDVYSKYEEEQAVENVTRVKEVVLNFKDPLKRLDILCNTAILLYQKGFIQLSDMLFKDIAKVKSNYMSNRIEVKILFLKGALRNNNNKLKPLSLALDMAKKEKEKELSSKICCVLGDYYLQKRDYFYSVNYYFEASEIIKSLAVQLPDELKLKFMNIPGMVNSFLMLMSMRKADNYDDIFEHRDRKFLVRGIKELKLLFDYEEFGEILTNKDFIKSAKKIYNSCLPKGIRNVKDIVKNLYANPLKNLDIIAKYLASVTLATRSLVIIDDYDQDYCAIASNDGNNKVPSCKFLFEKVRASREPLLINEAFIKGNNSEFIHVLQGKKAVICIPIIMNVEETRLNVRENKRKRSFLNSPVKGYIYLEAERILNNFNKEGMKRCLEVSKLAGSIIERYQLQISSSTDKLTGTLTRKSLEDALTEHIDRADEYNGFFSIIMIDLDLFKQINDRFGHQAGDEALRKVCSILKDNIRKEDVCGRYGGEEFIIILPETDSSDALSVAEKLRKEIERAKVLGDKMPVTVSMGIASYPEHAKWKQELIEKADQALYISKELGRNHCKVWSSEFSTKAKGTDKLTGIVSGNAVQDSRNVLVMLDILEIIKQESAIENKIFNYLGRIIEITESEYGMFFTIEDNKIEKKYARRVFEDKWAEIRSYNVEIIDSVIKNKQGAYMIDWDESPNYDSITGIPEWNSISAVPLIKNGEVKGILYLTVSTKKKEFKFEEFNFISALGELGVAIL